MSIKIGSIDNPTAISYVSNGNTVNLTEVYYKSSPSAQAVKVWPDDIPTDNVFLNQIHWPTSYCNRGLDHDPRWNLIEWVNQRDPQWIKFSAPRDLPYDQKFLWVKGTAMSNYYWYKWTLQKPDGTMYEFYDQNDHTITFDQPGTYNENVYYVLQDRKSVSASNPAYVTTTAENGTISPSLNREQYNQYITKSLMATPKPGYKFKDWLVLLTIDDQTATYSYGMTNNPVGMNFAYGGEYEVIANFEVDPDYHPPTEEKFNISSRCENGSISPSYSGAEFDIGKTIEFTVTPNYKHSFKKFILHDNNDIKPDVEYFTNPVSITFSDTGDYSIIGVCEQDPTPEPGPEPYSEDIYWYVERTGETFRDGVPGYVTTKEKAILHLSSQAKDRYQLYTGGYLHNEYPQIRYKDQVVITKVVTDDPIYLPSSCDHMFANMYWCESIDTTGWNTSRCTSFVSMFDYDLALKTLDVSNWDVSNVTSMYRMFIMCTDYYPTGSYLDLATFKDRTDYSNIFAPYNSTAISRGSKLTNIVGLENWNPQSCKNYSYMFKGCFSLTEIDFSAFVYPGNTDSMLAGCINLSRIYGPSNNALYDKGDRVFANCFKIVGEGGTTFNNVGSLGFTQSAGKLAKFDNGSTDPGYFWRKN